MHILRLSTLSLTLALAVVTLGYVDFASGAKPGRDCDPPSNHPSCQPDPGDTLNYTVHLRGTDDSLSLPPDFDIRGAFEFDGGAVGATLDKGSLKGGTDVTMIRPGNPTCDTGVPDDDDACTLWNNVFNLCGLLGPGPAEVMPGPDDGSGPTDLDDFTVRSGDWTVSKGGGRLWLSLEFTIDADDSPLTDRDLSASMQLTAACSDPVDDPSCEMDDLIPTEAGSTANVLTDARIHLRGKAGVTHQQLCHADDDELGANGSTLVITATDP